MTINVLGLSGSLRKASYNTALLRAAQELAPPGMRITIYDLSEIMIYNEDLRDDGYPPPVEAFRAAVNAADAVIMASPEYNRSVPAVLKNAIDWASRKPNQPFSQKPLAIVGVSNGALGAAFANYHLRQIFVHMDARLLNGAEVMIGGAKEKFDQHGTLTHEPTRVFVRAHLERLALLVKEVRAATVAQAVGTTRE
jgi:chromate reductase, NAD(P)H dehydrogenase (quinone)